jgi:hypothetical protein
MVEAQKELERCIEMLVTYGDSPEGCAEAAELYVKLKEWDYAAKMWGRAHNASVGHARRARYKLAQFRCEARCLKPLSKKHVMMLLSRVPEEATDILLNGPRVYFNMPEGWMPNEYSGIFNNDRDGLGCRWQIRL